MTRADIAGIHAGYGKSHPYGANRFVCVVRKMYNVGRQLGMTPEEKPNPGAEIQRFPEQKRRRYVTPAEMPRLTNLPPRAHLQPAASCLMCNLRN
jgi:hypothetical protein